MSGGRRLCSRRALPTPLCCGDACSENAWDFATDGATAALDFPGPANGLQTAQILLGPVVQVTCASKRGRAIGSRLTLLDFAGAPAVLVQELRVVVDPAAGFRVRYQLLSGDPSPRISVGAGPFNNSDSADAWGGNHSVDAIFRLDTGLTGNAAEGVGPVWYVDGNGLELQRHAFNWRPFYNGAGGQRV